MDEPLEREPSAAGENWPGEAVRRALSRARHLAAAHKAESACAGLLLVMAVNLLTVTARKSITNDESVLIPAAYYHVVAGDFQLVHEHPPLCKLLAGLPLVFILPNEARLQQPPSPAGSRAERARYESFWQDNRAHFEAISFWTRVPMVALTLALGTLIFIFARELAGAGAALFAVALFILEPTVLAHGRVVQTDIPAAFGYLLVFFTLHRYLKRPIWQRALWVGAAGGVALLGKFSMLVVCPVLAAVFAALLLRARGTGRAAPAAHACGAALALLIVVNAAYYFHSRPLTAEDARWAAGAFPGRWTAGAFPAWGEAIMRSTRLLSYVVPTDFVLGIYWQLWHSREGHAASLLGMYSRTGWWYYTPVAFALKTTIPFLLLSLASLAWAIGRVVKGHSRWLLILLIPFALYTGFVMMNRINIGVRYYLPAYPFLFILGGALLDQLLRPGRMRLAGAALAFTALGWMAVVAVRAYPDYMPYMNQLASRAPRWWYLSDSNVEWGDDVRELAAYLRARGETRVRAALLGGYSTLPLYGVEYLDLLSPDPADLPQTRYVALGASFLNGSTVPRRKANGVFLTEEERVNFFDAYRRRGPEAVIGGSIYLYRERE
jgi:4-amino-4-deoxy-L-arabinose transferase-like glycosyltransferase